MRVLAALGSLFLGSTLAIAQTPLGPEFSPSSSKIDASLQSPASVSCDEHSLCALVWASYKPTGETFELRQWGRIISPLGRLSPLQLLGDDKGLGNFIPNLPLNPGFVIFGQRGYQSGIYGFWIYDEKLHQKRGFVRPPFHFPPRYGDPDSRSGQGEVASIPGGFVEVQFGLDQPENPCEENSCNGIFLYFFDLKGRKLHDRVRVNADTSSWETMLISNLAVDGRGSILVSFFRIYGADERVKSFVRRFSSDGRALGPEFELGIGLPGHQFDPVVAASPNGQFLVAWTNSSYPGDAPGEIYAQRFESDGRPAGPPFRVSDPIPAQAVPLLAADQYGNYFISWTSNQDFKIGYHVRGRLYRHDGRPVTAGFRISQDTRWTQGGGRSSFAPNGTLTVTYESVELSELGSERPIPVLRRYAASPGQEICAISGVKIRCDLGRTGDGTELQLNWGGRPEEMTLFGDVDGDGRDEVCAYFQGTFRCDISHEGTATWSEALGSPGDVPLLADVDGDGLADPCLRRNNLLLCDTKRDGQFHSQTAFGLGGEEPLLGDLDGDRKADLCLVNGRTWDCLLTGGGQRHFQFGQRGASPALGDADRDGRADPCFLTPAGRLQCDSRHNGGADYSLALNVPPGARLLFGNLDGL